MPEPAFRNAAVKCLTEIGSIKIDDKYDNQFGKLLQLFMDRLATIIPPKTSKSLFFFFLF